jgi:hypothetical protein
MAGSRNRLRARPQLPDNLAGVARGPRAPAHAALRLHRGAPGRRRRPAARRRGLPRARRPRPRPGRAMARPAAGLPPAGLRRRPRAAHPVHRRRAADAARPALRGRQHLPGRLQPAAEPADVVGGHAQGRVALCAAGHALRHLDHRAGGARCAPAVRLHGREARRPAAEARLPARRVRARVDGAPPRARSAARRAGPLRGDRRRPGGRGGGRQPGAARLAGHRAGRGRPARLRCVGPAGGHARAARVARRRAAVAPHARRHPRDVERAGTAARRRPRLARQRRARTPARRRRARARRLERPRPE